MLRGKKRGREGDREGEWRGGEGRGGEGRGGEGRHVLCELTKRLRPQP